MMDIKYVSNDRSRLYMAFAFGGILGSATGLVCGYLWAKKSAEFQAEEGAKQLSLYDGDLQPLSFGFNIDENDRGMEIRSVSLVMEGGTGEIISVTPVDELEIYEEVERVNVFYNPREGDWDYDVEVKSRSDDEPYIIHVDEYMNDEMDFDQTTLTYYAGDHILCDESDVPIYNHERIVGQLVFGHGTSDPNTVYIRNVKLQKEWEIMRHTGHYQVEVQGLELEQEYEARDLKHSVIRRFRDE